MVDDNRIIDFFVEICYPYSSYRLISGCVHMPDAKSRKTENKVIDKTLSHDSIWLVFCIALLGVCSSLIFYHRFDINAQPYDFSTLSITATTTLLSTIDILISCRNYRRNSGWKVFTIILSIITIVLSSLLAIIPWLYSWKFIVVYNQELHLSQGNLSNIIDGICSVTGYLHVKLFIVLYTIAFVLQALSNLSRLMLKRFYRRKAKNDKTTKS